MFPAQLIYGLDIETDTSACTPHELELGFTSRGLDSRISPILNAALSTHEDVTVFRGDEVSILTQLADAMTHLEPGLLVTWNGSCFDLPFLADRAAQHDITLGLNLRLCPDIQPKYPPALQGQDFRPWHSSRLAGASSGYLAWWDSNVPARSHTHLDIAYAYRGEAVEGGWSLKPIAAAHGIPMIVVDRTQTHLLVDAELDAYVASDAVGTRLLSLKLLGA